MNAITIKGRLARDPEINHTNSGLAVCSFSVAVDRKFKDKQSGDKITDWFEVQTWRQTAEFVSKYFHKGSEILISGTMQSRKFEDKNGNKRIAWELVADNVEFCGGKSASADIPYSAPSEPALSQGTGDDFAVVDDNEDLPF